MNQTEQQFDKIVSICKDIFIKKLKDYGASWRLLRPSSVTDQLFIKANRIRSIQMKGTSKINEDIKSEFIGIINYGIIGLIQLELGFAEKVDISAEQAVELYDKYIQKSKDLMSNKNHDYDEAWRRMRVESFVDIILMKICRIKEIENHAGKTLISEGIDANYYDIINYSIFALIKLEEIEKNAQQPLNN
ncbi:MAG TPA: DUF1599 domain-containing protein [Paludibacteraceae bacterium]|nr:DUF1599 domain-containing protein [Paludibacteraceae bacterium]HOV83881.1 DUF1599 domain-containing protein [Paludibacteraceae bacterium]